MLRALFLSLILTIHALAFECVGCEKLKNSPPNKVYAPNPTLLYHLYAIDKSKAAGLVFEFWDMEKEYLDSNFTNLPVVGGFVGQGRTPNMEAVLKLNPDLIITTTFTKNEYKALFEKSKIPVLYINALTLEESLNSFIPLAEILGVKDRGEELYTYAKKSIDIAKNAANRHKNSKKLRIYYAYGEDGLQTECENSGVGVAVSLIGGEMVHKCKDLRQNSRISLNFEQILNYQPDIIIAYRKEFYDQIYKDPKWSHLEAVKNKRVYLIPRKPFSWVGKPASFMRFLGIRWLVSKVYEDENIDIRDETKEFYKLFLYLDLSESQLDDILNTKG